MRRLALLASASPWTGASCQARTKNSYYASKNSRAPLRQVAGSQIADMSGYGIKRGMWVLLSTPSLSRNGHIPVLVARTGGPLLATNRQFSGKPICSRQGRRILQIPIDDGIGGAIGESE